ncbi:MAG: HGGxSTG domain-containing protein [Rhizobiaceae bacterium]
MRCGARTRAGTSCQKPALKGKCRCQLHGGRAGAPSGAKNGNYKHGRFTQDAIRRRSEAVSRVRALARLAKAARLF